jgi:serine/threonine protein kinase
MPNPKATTPATGARRQAKRTKASSAAQAFVWKSREWTEKKKLTEVVRLMVSKTNPKQLVVKKIFCITANSADDPTPFEIRALAMLPDCNRVVKALCYSHADPDPTHGSAFFMHFPLGDLVQWKEHVFEIKNWKPVPESFIWRFFLQISQALAFIQNKTGPDRDQRSCMIHRDIKPANILVVDNGTTYPSFKLHDFGCAMIYQKSKARQKARCGTFSWQPPENPIINTTAAEVWALGACAYFLATADSPIESITDYESALLKQNDGQDPESVEAYGSKIHYYAARVPRNVASININEEEQRRRGMLPVMVGAKPHFNHQYSDELNDWVKQCTSKTPSHRPTAERLTHGMSLVARGMLRKMGGNTALLDLDVVFGSSV